MLFSDRKFIIVKAQDHRDVPEETEELITENGGTVTTWKDRLDRDVTPQLVVVSTTAEFSHYNELNNLMVPTVTPAWIDDCIETGKLIPTRPYSPDPKNFLCKVMICCAGLSKGDTDAIQAGVRAVGGDHSENLTRYTTHLITTSLDGEKAQTAINCDQDIKVVSPEWIDDCIKLQHRIDEAPYLLYLNGQASDRVSTPRRGSTQSGHADLTGTYSMDDRDDTPRLAVQSSVRKGLGSTMFAGKYFYLGKDLDISPLLQKTIIYLIETNGGNVVDSLENASVYLGKWREGDEYVSACLSRLVVGNLTWLYWMAIKQKWDLPTKYLLHYPEVREGLPGMEDMVIAITNYTGDSRAYLQSLIRSLGAKYTGTLVENVNTHLIAAHTGGPKYEGAQKWGIKVVNHLWLEETYSKWHVQPVNLPRYTHLPLRLDLTTLIGCTHLVPSVLKGFYSTNVQPERERNPSRAARTKADEVLHESVMKENIYQKQRRNKGLPALAEVDTANEPAGTKRSAGDRDQENGAEDQAAQVESHSADSTLDTPDLSKSPEPKKSRKKEHAKEVVVTITGVDKPPAKAKLSRVGIKVVENNTALILVAPRILRTQKFLSSISHVRTCVLPAWLDASIKAGHPVDTSDYEIDSPLLQDTLRKSASLREQLRGLFDGLKFFLLPAVKGGPKVVEQIVKAHGGKVVRSQNGAVIVHGEGDEGLVMDDVINAILDMDRSKLEEGLKML